MEAGIAEKSGNAGGAKAFTAINRETGKHSPYTEMEDG
jgi:hypothetical protein